MSRTNFDIDDALVAEVMNRFDLSSKREAVNFALRRDADFEHLAQDTGLETVDLREPRQSS